MIQQYYTKEQIDELVFNKESGDKMKDKLKVKVWNYKNVVLLEVLEQDESIRGKGPLFRASNGWILFSFNEGGIESYLKELYINREKKEQDKIVIVSQEKEIKDAKKVVEEIKQAVKEFNASFNQILDEEEKEYLSAVIKPYRDRVEYIAKVDAHYIEKEYIRIKIGGENMPMPNFKSGSMYKGMELDREYTLEELGL